MDRPAAASYRDIASHDLTISRLSAAQLVDGERAYPLARKRPHDGGFNRDFHVSRLSLPTRSAFSRAWSTPPPPS